MSPKFYEYLVNMCFERRFTKQNTVGSLISKIFPQKNFWAGYATVAQSQEMSHFNTNHPFLKNNI